MVQEFLSSVDNDKDAVSNQVDHLDSRWRSFEKNVDGLVKSLEDKSAKLAEQHDMLTDITKQVKECEDMLTSHNTLGTSAYDNKHLDRIKVHTSVCLSYLSVSNPPYLRYPVTYL